MLRKSRRLISHGSSIHHHQSLKLLPLIHHQSFQSIQKRTYISDYWPKWPEKFITHIVPPEVTADPAIEANFFYPHHLMSLLMDCLHNIGFSWLFAGVSVTILTRMALLPLFMYSNKLMAIAAVLGSETKRRSEMIKFSRHLEDNKAVEFWIRAMKVLSFEHKEFLSPVRRFIYPVTLVCASVTNIMAIRFLSATMPSMRREEFLWIQDFTLRSIDFDPSLKLPLICAALQFTSQAINLSGQWRALKQGGRYQPLPIALGTLGVVVSGVFVIVSPYLHQGVLLCYWLPSTLMSVLQTLSLRIPAFGVARSIRDSPDVKLARAASSAWNREPLNTGDVKRLFYGVVQHPQQQPGDAEQALPKELQQKFDEADQKKVAEARRHYHKTKPVVKRKKRTPAKQKK